MLRSLRYLRVLLTFAQNSLVRDMNFRMNFVIDAVSSVAWVLMNLGFYVLIFQHAPSIGAGTGWGKNEFFLFLATGLMINSVVQALFMPNADALSERVRTGTLDFALLKPIDTQFLVSLERIEWPSFANFFVGLVLLVYSLSKLGHAPTAAEGVLYVFYLLCGIAIYYSLMMSMASTSVWLGRNMTLLDFWFYITNFSRYPKEIYQGRFGDPLRWAFTFVIPVLLVVNVPARILVRPLSPQTAEEWLLPAFAIIATIASLAASRWIFLRALRSYRSASS